MRSLRPSTDRRARQNSSVGRDLQVCHCDLWADNVVGTPTGGVCVIDRENCGPADPSQELGNRPRRRANGSAT
jgi:thiamine kinase-like enzyme